MSVFLATTGNQGKPSAREAAKGGGRQGLKGQGESYVRRRAKAPAAGLPSANMPKQVKDAGSVACSARERLRTQRCAVAMFALGVLGLVAFLGSSAPTVGAAEAFPGQGFLPDNRAWEMVSPPNKNGGDVHPNSFPTRAPTAGNATQFVAPAGCGDSQSTGLLGEYIAERTAAPATNGWA